jgi:phosphoglycolate phosphatase
VTRTTLAIFDIDGTLHDFTRWWPDVLRQGLADFAARHGFAPARPDDAAANAIVGLADAALWSPFLPAEQRHRWREFRELVLPRELTELRAGRDHLFPGIRALLRRLRAAGVAVALASNCRSRYLAAMLDGQQLAPLVDAAFCLDSERVQTKADMVAAALQQTGRSAAGAVMVGDRVSDHDAARAHGLRFAWRANPFVAPVPADLTWQGDPDQLLCWLGLPGITTPAGA